MSGIDRFLGWQNILVMFVLLGLVVGVLIFFGVIGEDDIAENSAISESYDLSYKLQDNWVDTVVSVPVKYAEGGCDYVMKKSLTGIPNAWRPLLTEAACVTPNGTVVSYSSADIAVIWSGK